MIDLAANNNISRAEFITIHDTHWGTWKEEELDNPLKEHNLLQAIARTNCVYGSHKALRASPLLLIVIACSKVMNLSLICFHCRAILPQFYPKLLKITPKMF